MKHHLNPQGGIVIHSLGYDEMFASAPFLKSIGNFVSFNLWKSLPTDFPHKVSPRRMDTSVAKFLDVSAKTHREQRLLCDSAKTNEHVFRETQNLCFHICVDPLVYQRDITSLRAGSPPMASGHFTCVVSSINALWEKRMYEREGETWKPFVFFVRHKRKTWINSRSLWIKLWRWSAHKQAVLSHMF